MNCKNIADENHSKKERATVNEIILTNNNNNKESVAERKLIVLMKREVESVEKFRLGLIVWQAKENDAELYTVWR